VNLLEFNLQHVTVQDKHLQNVDPIQLMLQLLVETLQPNNVNKDVQLVQHQLEEHHHLIKHQLEEHQQLVIVMDKQLHNVDHLQQTDQLHVELELM
jgi:hypothetical protein